MQDRVAGLRLQDLQNVLLPGAHQGRHSGVQRTRISPHALRRVHAQVVEVEKGAGQVYSGLLPVFRSLRYHHDGHCEKSARDELTENR